MKAYDEKVLWPIFSKYIRVRDSVDGLIKCFTCGRVVRWQDADCGHGIPRQYKATKYNEKNNHAQCKHCNGFEGGRRETYKQEMNRRYGDGTWELMELESKKVCKRARFEYDAMAKYYKAEFEKICKLRDVK